MPILTAAAIAGLKAAAPSLIEGGFGLYQNIAGARQAKRQQESAREAFERSKAEYFAQDISNPYANMENVYEDLTVNQQQAAFQAEQQQQALANTMQSMRGASGGSGIAAFTQALANQQAKNLQQASASIGMQESRIQQLQAGEAARIQRLERQGDIYSRQRQEDLLGTRLGMDITDLQAQTDALQGFREGIAGGVGNIAGGVLDYYSGVQGYNDDIALKEAIKKIQQQNSEQSDLPPPTQKDIYIDAGVAFDKRTGLPIQ